LSYIFQPISIPACHNCGTCKHVRTHTSTHACTYTHTHIFTKNNNDPEKDKIAPSQREDFRRAPHTIWWLQYKLHVKPCFYCTLFFPDSEWLQLLGQKNVTWSWSVMWACMLHITTEGQHGF